VKEQRAVVKGLLVTHGDLGQALLRVVEGFLGPQKEIAVISNVGLGASDLSARVEREVALVEGDELFIFTDLDGGSCGNACSALVRGRARCYGVSGLNLPMLVEFCHYRDRLAGDRLLERVTRKAREGIVVSGGRVA
jgi:PTS system mannose-specific IIA component